MSLARYSGLAVSPDGTQAYLTGLRATASGNSPGLPVVHRVGLPARGPAEVFFGDPAKPGAGESGLAAGPRGLAVDGAGRLLVADHGNGRVAVLDGKSGKLAGELKVPSPHAVGVDPGSGAVYVLSLPKGGSGDLVKFDGWKSGRELARLPVKNDGNPDFPWSMALDASAKPPIVWLGSDGGRLLRIEDRGARLEVAEVSSRKIGNGAFVGLEVDRFREDPEVYARCGRFPVTWFRYNEAGDEVSTISVSAGTSCIVPGPGGVLYAAEWPYHLYRYGREGKPLPWEKGSYPERIGIKGQDTEVKKSPHGLYLPVSMTFMTHTVGVRGDGRIFVFDPGAPGGRPPKMLVEYLPTGERVKQPPIIWKVSDTAVGPRFDPQGNIYVAEQVKPPGEPYPDDFLAVLGKKVALAADGGRSESLDGPHRETANMYGSIVKFSPKGGMVHFASGDPAKDLKRMGPTGIDPFEGNPELEASLPTVDAAYFRMGRLYPVKVTGALWMRMGISHVDFLSCNCENTRFDVDEFGRVFYPDMGRFRVGVLDTAGNPITHFGTYGNSDDPPRDAKSAIRNPQSEIHLAWLIGVGATDKYAYTGDSLNRRMLRAKLVYAAQESCEIQ